MVSSEEWGPTTWNLLHGIAERIGKHTNPKLAKDEQNELFFTLRQLWALLPCIKCQTHYREWIRIHPPDCSLYGEYLQDSIRIWVYKLHEAVNQRNSVTSGITMEQLADRYKDVDLRASAIHLRSFYQRGLQTNVLKPDTWKAAWKHLDYLLRFIGV